MPGRMHKGIRQTLKYSGLTVGFLLLAGVDKCDCNPPPVADNPSKEFEAGNVFGTVEPPEIMPPEIKVRRPLQVDEKGLPKGAHAHFPAYDGDSFFISLPVTRSAGVTASEIQKSLDPILNSIGFRRGAGALLAPPESGVPQPVADSKGLGRQVAYEYANNPKEGGQGTREMILALIGETQPSAQLDAAMQVGEGMTFAQFVAGIERLEIKYPFNQVDLSMQTPVPIEHTQLVASRWDLQGVTSLYGNLFDQYKIVNGVKIPAGSAFATAQKALASVKGIERVPERKEAVDGPYLILFPYTTDANGLAQLHYSYRMTLTGVSYGHQGDFQLWLDAEDGSILKMVALFGDVGGKGKVYNRDPGAGTATQDFAVDPSSGGKYQLKLASKINRVDFLGNGFDANDVSIDDSAGGSSSSLANFDQSALNDPAQALCGTGTNKAFQQVNFYGTIHRNIEYAIQLGMFLPFPPSPFTPKVESASAGCNAWSSMDYGACHGYFDAACPSYTTGTINSSNWMNMAHDNTVISHEFTHNVTPRLTSGRPANWCCAPMATCSPTCAVPVGWGWFHDLADFFADHLEGTNCTAGWVTKNDGGVDYSLNCAHHQEGGGIPRLHSVTIPFNPAAAGDHFPEHRASGNTGDYANGQMAAAALWQVRAGMRSKCRPSGIPQFGVRYFRALKNAGFLGFTPANTDLGNYQQMEELERQMADQWATSGSPMGPPAFAHNGPHSINKVTGGFARAGVFLIPYQCLDGNNATHDPTSCPAADNGADAVVDIDDNDPANDVTINGVAIPVVDFLKIGGTPPTFHVWTGPRYRLDGAGGVSSLTSPSPCNSKFQVEVSLDPTFAPGPTTITSAWTNVDTDPTTANSPECYGDFTLSAGDWMTLQSAGSKFYYRARTRDAMDMNERLSTTPGNGLWGTVIPPYAVATATGQSDY